MKEEHLRKRRNGMMRVSEGKPRKGGSRRGGGLLGAISVDEAIILMD